MTPTWTNWSGSVSFRPFRFEMPRDEAEAVELVRRAASEERHVRAVGSGHSSSQMLPTDDVLLSLEKLSGLEAVDAGRKEAWFAP
jgi:FAD/FMN-containing dehydrogenase